NCELTKPGQDVQHGSVTIVGPLNIPSMLSEHASEMYARNLLNLLTLFVKEGEVALNWEDEVIARTALTHEGEVVNEAARESLGAEATSTGGKKKTGSGGSKSKATDNSKGDSK